MPENPPIVAGTRIGHVHLKVADLERALGFYCGVLGFELQQRLGTDAAFISAGGYHHHIGLNTWESKGGRPPPPGTTGLFHTAILYPTRPALADALHRVLSAGIQLDGASDHGVSQALYLRDPDENGVELYWDRPEAEWPRSAAVRAHAPPAAPRPGRAHGRLPRPFGSRAAVGGRGHRRAYRRPPPAPHRQPRDLLPPFARHSERPRRLKLTM